MTAAGRPAADGPVASFLTALAGRGRAPNTVAAYGRDLAAYERFLRTRRGIAADAATNADVEAFVAYLEQAGRKRSSIARALVSVRAFHRHLVEQGGAASDPARSVSSGPVPAATAAVLDVARVNLLLDGVRGDGPQVRRDRAILELLYGAALRPSEVVHLDRDDVSLDGIVAVEGRGGTRYIPAGEAAAEAVQAWLAPGGRGRLAAPGWSAGDDAHALFVNHRGSRLTRQGVWLILRRWVEAQGLPAGQGPQVLRHSCAAHLAAAGMAAELVAEMLGSTASGGQNRPSGALVEAHRRLHPRNRVRAGR